VTTDELETLVAAVCVKAELPTNVSALVRGMPRRHAEPLSLQGSADFIIRRWANGETETQILQDKFRDDLP